MAKDEAKREKKVKRKSEGADTDMGDVSVVSTTSEKKAKKDKKEKKVKTEDEDADMDEDAVTKGEVSPEAISPIARECRC